MKCEWKTEPLRNMISFISKGIAPVYADSESDTTIRVLNQKCNRNFSISYAESRLHNVAAKKVPDERYIIKDDILINSTGTGTAGRIAQVKYVPCPTTVDGHMIIIRANEKVTQKYLGFALKAHQWEILKLDEGSTGQTELNRERLLDEIMVSYPISHYEQNKIVNILSTIDDKIELNQKINDNLERQAQAIFENSFIDNPENIAWKVGTFSELIISTLNGDWGKEEPTGNNTEKVYCIRGADIPEVKVGNKGKMPTRYILPKNLSSKKLEVGDIVIEISGGSPTQSTGRCAAITQSLLERYDSSMVCTNFCKAIKPKSGYSLFVYFYWQYLYQKDVFFSYENGTTGIKNLDFAGVVETEQIIIPPIDKIARFNDLCASLLDQIFANGKQNEQLASLRDALLPKLMSGELEVSEISTI